WADPFACSRPHRQQSPPHARSLTFSAHFGTAVPRSRLSLSTLAAAANASIVSGGHLPALTQRTSTMGYKQTSPHRFGKGSYHQIGLVRGQFGNVPINQWLQFLKETGFDGWEEASWELDVARCATDADAEKYARERLDLAKKHGLEIFTVAAHL